MRVLDLFSGIGGFSLGLERAGMRTVGFCEIDPYCRAVLAKHWPHVPCHGDVRTFFPGPGAADVVCGGFPCQDISQAGKGIGIEGSRSGLWFEFLRIICEVRPRYAIVENVSELLVDGIDTVIGGLADVRYDAEWYCIPASYVGAPQARKRIWIVAYPDSGGREADDERLEALPPLGRWFDHDRLGAAQRFASACPGIARRAHDDVPAWVDRITALGNAVVPGIPEMIGRAIMELEHGR